MMGADGYSSIILLVEIIKAEIYNGILGPFFFFFNFRPSFRPIDFLSSYRSSIGGSLLFLDIYIYLNKEQDHNPEDPMYNLL